MPQEVDTLPHFTEPNQSPRSSVLCIYHTHVRAKSGHTVELTGEMTKRKKPISQVRNMKNIVEYKMWSNGTRTNVRCHQVLTTRSIDQTPIKRGRG